MKQVFLMLFAAGAVLSVNAQKLDAAKVPAVVKTNFSKQFPKAEAIKWELEDGQYEAGFKQGADKMAANYKPDGSFVESEVMIPVSSLPAPVTEYMAAHYKGIAVKEAARITKANGTVNFEAEIKGKDVVFDADGKFLKEEKD